MTNALRLALLFSLLMSPIALVPDKPFVAMPFGIPGDRDGDGDDGPAVDPPEIQAKWYDRDIQIKNVLRTKVDLLSAATMSSDHPVHCRVYYTTASSGVLSGTQVKTSGNQDFDAICLNAVKSLAAQSALLKYPEGAHYATHCVVGDITFNYRGMHRQNQLHLSEQDIQNLLKLSTSQMQTLLDLPAVEVRNALK